MARLDDDAVQVLKLLAARGQVDITTLSPPEVRAHYAQFPSAPGPDLHQVRDLTVAGAAGDLPARLYRPSAAENLPVLIWFHGGGMVLGDLKSGDWACRELCLQAQTLVISVEYRLAPEHKFPAAPEDAYAALGWVAAHAAALGGDPARISVGGDSAGGTLAAVCCLLAKARGGPAIRAQLLVYPGADRDLTRPSITEFARGPILTRDTMLWFRGHYHASEEELADPRANPSLAADHAGLPPACVLNAEIDPLRDAGEAYAGILARAGVLTTMRRYNGVFHGFFTMGPAMAKTRQAVEDAAWFLKSV
jgi:acetyl esterase